MVIRSVLSACLSMDPAKRPDAERTREWLKRLDKGGSVLDGILASLDKYSAELEEKIAARSGELVIEMAKVDVLLKEMIPGYGKLCVHTRTHLLTTRAGSDCLDWIHVVSQPEENS